MNVTIPSEIKDQSIEVGIPIKVRYDEYYNESGHNNTIVLLHGYGERKERIYKMLGQYLRGLARRLIILNAPFPALQFGNKSISEGYAWYYRSLKYNMTLIPPESSNVLFDKFIETANLKEEPVTII